MSANGVFQGLEYAKTKSKPVLLYFNSTECHSCGKFSDAVMSDHEVAEYAKHTYINIYANIENADARKMSRKYKAYMLPAVVLLNSEQDFEFTCQLSLDKEMLVTQMKNFLNAIALREQILLIQRTNHLSFEEASKQIGISYAKIDFKKNPVGNPEEIFANRSVGMKYFAPCGEAYLEEWKEQKTKIRASK